MIKRLFSRSSKSTAIDHPSGTERSALFDISGFAIWVSVSDEVDAKIREQVKAGAFPVRLKPEGWNSGAINWLLDEVAADKKMTGRVIANFGTVLKGSDLRLHPMVAGLVDEKMRARMGNGK